MPKPLFQLRNEATDPHKKLGYEIINRFNSHNVKLALNGMTTPLKEIVMECIELDEELKRMLGAEAIRNDENF